MQPQILFEKLKDNKDELILIFLIPITILGIFVLGWSGNEIYKDYTNKKMFDGLRFEYNDSHPQAINLAKTYDNYGDWVCVNIKGMEYTRAIQVCDHEVGHEIFAKECEGNISRCMEVVGK